MGTVDVQQQQPPLACGPSNSANWFAFPDAWMKWTKPQNNDDSHIISIIIGLSRADRSRSSRRSRRALGCGCVRVNHGPDRKRGLSVSVYCERTMGYPRSNDLDQPPSNEGGDRRVDDTGRDTVGQFTGRPRDRLHHRPRRRYRLEIDIRSNPTLPLQLNHRSRIISEL